MKRLKNFTAGLLAVLMLSTPCYARGNYTYQTVSSEYYNASSPVGTTTYYRGAIPSANYYVNSGIYPVESYYPAVNSYNYGAGVAAANTGTYYSTTVNTPQAYNRQVVNTATYIDQRETIDKNIERSGKILGILGGAAILGLGTAAIIHHAF